MDSGTGQTVSVCPRWVEKNKQVCEKNKRVNIERNSYNIGHYVRLDVTLQRNLDRFNRVRLPVFVFLLFSRSRTLDPDPFPGERRAGPFGLEFLIMFDYHQR